MEIGVDEETSRLKLMGKPTLYYKYPARKGDSYDLVYWYEGKADTYSAMTVTETDLEVKTAAGTFRCYKYESRTKEDGILEGINYVCPGIGMVKFESYDDGKLIESSELKKYTIADKNE